VAKKEVLTVTAMCHVYSDYVIIAHEGGALTCWSVADSKLVQTDEIKCLAAGDIYSITQSPNEEDHEVILASSKGCTFAKVTNKGTIIEDLFEIYFSNTDIDYIGYINFKNYFATEKTSKRVFWFTRHYDDKH
jgi:hypothetical protein